MSGQGDRLLEEYCREVLRWNRQINLISRQDSSVRLDGLVRQCQAAWSRLIDDDPAGLASARCLWYFDLGSGAGLPGFVWHVAARLAGLPAQTCLVEPREKRAWFLDRLNRIEGAAPLAAVPGRWGEGQAGDSVPDPFPSHILISLKALHLTDAEVLEGLAAQTPVVAGCEIIIARFYPPDQGWGEELAAELGIPVRGEEVAHGRRRYLATGGRVLAPGLPDGASLVLSLYRTPE